MIFISYLWTRNDLKKDKFIFINKYSIFAFSPQKKLYCKICFEEFDLESSKNDYKLVKIIKHNDKEIMPIIL